MIRRSFKRAWAARLGAKFIDLVVFIVLSFLLFPFGFFAALIYLALADSLGDGQSLGKRVIGMRVVDINTHEKCHWKQSVVRNLPLVAPLALIVIPILGWFVGGLLFVVFSAAEIYLFITFKSKQRLGDMMAETTVVIGEEKPESFKKKMSWFENSSVSLATSSCEN